MKVIQKLDGTISAIDEDEKPNGFTEELNIESVKTEVPQILIDECERLSKDGITRFIFDKNLTNTARRKVSYSKQEDRDIEEPQIN